MGQPSRAPSCSWRNQFSVLCLGGFLCSLSAQKVIRWPLHSHRLPSFLGPLCFCSPQLGVFLSFELSGTGTRFCHCLYGRIAGHIMATRYGLPHQPGVGCSQVTAMAHLLLVFSHVRLFWINGAPFTCTLVVGVPSFLGV